MTDAIPTRVANTSGTATTAMPTWISTTSTRIEPDIYDELVRAVTVLAVAMRKWKETL